jgi:hypothetical protein
MSDAFDVLPIIIPFFGVTICSSCIAICCLWRTVNSRFISLEHRMEQLSILPINPPPPPPPTPNYPSPTYLSPTYPMYPSQTQPTSVAVPYPLYPNITYNI